LIEVLVVVAIIALLLAILLPSLGKAREMAKRAHCGANFSNIGTAWYMYANDHQDYFPPSYAGGTWSIIFDFTKSYFDKRRLGGDIFMCPTFKSNINPANGLPYGWNNMQQTTQTNWGAGGPSQSVTAEWVVTGYSFWTNIICYPYYQESGGEVSLRCWLPIREYTATTGLAPSWAEALVDGWSSSFQLVPWMNKTTDTSAQVRTGNYLTGPWKTRRFTPAEARIAWDKVALDRVTYGAPGYDPEIVRHYRDGPTGANVLYGDGHIKWKRFKQMHEVVQQSDADGPIHAQYY
jgi:prepilin-type processing-associated H-X9-DG protein